MSQSAAKYSRTLPLHYTPAWRYMSPVCRSDSCKRHTFAIPARRPRPLFLCFCWMVSRRRRWREPGLGEKCPIVLLANAQIHIGFGLQYSWHFIQLLRQKFEQVIVIATDDLGQQIKAAGANNQIDDLIKGRDFLRHFQQAVT